MINLQNETDDYNTRANVGVGLLHVQDDDHEPVASTSSLSEQLHIVTDGGLSAIDKQLIQGKQHIDSLLEKLTLMTAPEVEAARYVSGCSVNQETEKATDILKEFGIEATTNINAESLFNPDMFKRIYEGVEGGSSEEPTSNSSSSLLTLFSGYRRAPDGQGASIDDKTKPVS